MEFSTNYPTICFPGGKGLHPHEYDRIYHHPHLWPQVGREAKTHLLNLYHSRAHCDNTCWPGNSWLAKHDCHWTKEENVLSPTLWTNNLAEIVVGGITQVRWISLFMVPPHFLLPLSKLCSQTSVFCASSLDVIQYEVIFHLDFKRAGNAISQWLEGSTPFYFWLSCLLICSALKFDPSQYMTRFV